MSDGNPSSWQSMFHPLVSSWFERRYGSPTDIQARAWPEIAAGGHVLVAAPTGSGKTMTAFLHAIDRMITDDVSSGGVRVLYISPLKALNNDIRRNLLAPLEELKEEFLAACMDFPPVNVSVRSGDTPPEERRRMLKRPPEILITTPESLNILLTSAGGRTLFSGLELVIMDEIHAVFDSKRGTHLITAVERLTLIAGEFQRIALSATVNPLAAVADFIGGLRPAGGHYEKRPVAIISSSGAKRFALSVIFPEEAPVNPEDGTRWPALVELFRGIISDNSSTLFFANSRRMVEKIARFINEDQAEEIAFSHHGSLSREIRLLVEEKLKGGEIRGIVATNSLELGIDIGRCDRVVMIQAPQSVSSAVQKLGRSGHGVGEVSRGCIVPTHGRDFIDSAVMARCVMERDIEEKKAVMAPLDVLAQVILSMTSVEPWNIDELYAFMLRCHPYRDLKRRHFDLVVDMLEGRYADSRIRELTPRISVDRIDNMAQAREGAAYHLYSSGGTIPDRGYYDMRVAGTKSRIGELDEEFVWERSAGDTFSMGTQAWRIQNITHNEVEVASVRTRPGMIPFWKGEESNRGSHFMERVAAFLEEAEGLVADEEAFRLRLMERYFMEGPAARELSDFCLLQRKSTGSPLPHRHHLLVERFSDPANRSDTSQLLLHTLWGGKINAPFSMALAEAWEEKYGYRLEVIYNNDALLLILPHDFSSSLLFDLVTEDNLEPLLRRRLEKTGFFGARFRENAGRSLLLPSAGFRKRLPLWLNRLRSRKLLDAVREYSDFPVLLETWRGCMADEFELEALRLRLSEIRAGEIVITETVTAEASPFAGGLIWQQTNKHMYADDSPGSGLRSNLSDSLIREVALSPQLRPMLPPDLADELQRKLHRTAPGYAPSSPQELLDWLKERLLVPEEEWEELLDSMTGDIEGDMDEFFSGIKNKVCMVSFPGAEIRSMTAVETLPLLADAFGLTLHELHLLSFDEKTDEPALRKKAEKAMRSYSDREVFSLSDFLSQWISYYAPVSLEFIGRVTGFVRGDILPDLERLLEEDALVMDLLVEGRGEEICDRENLEILLRMHRSRQRPTFEALDIRYLQVFIAAHQGLIRPLQDISGLQRGLESLFGYPAPAALWEEHVFPARISPYYGSWLDSLMNTSGLAWFGCGRERISFAFPEDLGFFIPAADRKPEELSDVTELFPSLHGAFTIDDICRHSGLKGREILPRLWNLAWKGLAGASSFEAVRRGIHDSFGAPDRPDRRRADGFTRMMNRWDAMGPERMRWRAMTAGEGAEPDLLREAAINRDRVRLLLRRYGILFRELLERELPPLRWKNLFRTIRLMELSGEIASGYFFTGIPGLQFMSHEAFRSLQRGAADDSFYWMNAADPASLCGLKMECFKNRLPARKASTLLAFRGPLLVMEARKSGRDITMNCEPGTDLARRCFSVFRDIISRDFNAPGSITVEFINGAGAAAGPFRDDLEGCGFRADYKTMTLFRSYA